MGKNDQQKPGESNEANEVDKILAENLKLAEELKNIKEKNDKLQGALKAQTDHEQIVDNLTRDLEAATSQKDAQAKEITNLTIENAKLKSRITELESGKSDSKTGFSWSKKFNSGKSE